MGPRPSTDLPAADRGRPRRRRPPVARPALVALTFAALVAACGRPGTVPGPGFVVRDSAGVTIMENHAPAWGAIAPLQVAPEAALRLGPFVTDGDGALTAVRLAGGGVVVANRDSRALSRYDRDGRLLWRLDTDVPGEPTPEPVAVQRLAGDTILVAHAGNGRITRYSAEGDRLSGARPPAAGASGPGNMVWHGGDAGYRLVQADARGQARRIVAREAPRAGARYAELRTDPAGRAWVRPAFTELAQMWDVYDPLGRWLGTVRLPALDRLHDIGSDYVLGSLRDARGSEWVVMHAMERVRARR